jgi:hypothetical protein
MKNLILVSILLAVITASGWSVALANDKASQIVTFCVQAVNEIAVAGDWKITDIRTAMVGSQSVKVINATSTYLVTTNEEQKKITGFLNTSLPKDSNLSISLEAPAGAISAGGVDLKNTPVDLVTAVSKVADAHRVITYTFTSPVVARLTKPLSQVVTLTITN